MVEDGPVWAPTKDLDARLVCGARMGFHENEEPMLDRGLRA
jgi:hypothetical protein